MKRHILLIIHKIKNVEMKPSVRSAITHTYLFKHQIPSDFKLKGLFTKLLPVTDVGLKRAFSI